MSSGTIVRCASCGVGNRLTKHAGEGRYSCGRCGAPIAVRREWGTLARFAFLCGIAAFAWAAWPVSGWLGLCVFAVWLLNAAATKYLPLYNDPPKAILRPVLRLTLQNLAKATSYVGIGIATVGLAQIGLSLVGHVSPEALRETELFLSDARLFVCELLGFEYLLVALGALVAITMLFPRSRLMTHLLRARSVAGRLYLVLLGITSFTFFSALDVKVQEESWQRQARYQARQHLAAAEELSRDIAGVVWMEEQVKRLPDDQKQAIGRFFGHAVKQVSPTSEIKQLAHRLAGAAPNLRPRLADAIGAQSDGRLLNKAMEAHIKSVGSIGPEAPTVRQVEVATAELKLHAARLQAVRTAAIELAAEGIASLLSEGQKPLAKAFVEELAGTLSRGSLSRIVPRADSSVVARTWVTTNLLSPVSSEVVGAESKWVWDAAHFETKTAKIAPHLLPGVRPPIGGFTPHSPYSFPHTTATPRSSGGGFRIRR